MSLDRPTYRTPPVVEVILSAAFEPIAGLGLIKLGDLWREHFAALPNVDEKPRLEMPVERFDLAGGAAVSLTMMRALPLPRLWFQNSTRTQLVQIQNDFLARNWRRGDSGTEYPRYPALRRLFAEDVEHLAAFVRKEQLGEFAPTQCELTYVNHVLGSTVADLLVTMTDSDTSAFPDADAASFRTQFVIRDGDQPVGRLHVEATTARRKDTREPLVVLTITARGRPIGRGPDGVFSFLDLGREWCRRAFDTMTRREMQRAWGRTDA